MMDQDHPILPEPLDPADPNRLTDGAAKPEKAEKPKPKPQKADGHRERMRKRFRDEGFEHIETHRLLEMLLYYSIPRRDTREDAVALLTRFRSLRGVLEADTNELLRIPGIGDSSAMLIKLVYSLLCRMNEAQIEPSAKYATPDAIGKLFCDLTRYKKNEVLYLAAFDNSRRLIDTLMLEDRMNGQVSAQLRGIVEFAFSSGAVFMAAGHNHPSGDLIPSLNDISFTVRLRDYLSAIGIVLLEHFVCTDEGYYPIVKNRL